MKKLCMIMATAAALSACGGGSGFIGQAGPDAFVAEVLKVIGTTSETGEPIAIEALVATTPEDTEPVSLN
ncbi:MAG: hypothetical protein ACI83P_002899 [Janthinobacterium sp.]|jgi:hypothetical protein